MTLACYIYLELDLFAVALLLLMIGFHNRRDALSAEQRLFNLVLISTAATIFFDALQWFLDGEGGLRGALVASTYLYYVSNTAVPLLWLVYCDYKVMGSVSGLRRRLRFYAPPLAVLALFLATNAWTGFVFGFDAGNCYRRGRLFLLYSVISYLPIFFTVALIVRKFKTVGAGAERQELKYLLFFMLLPSLGFVAQSLFYGLPLIWIAGVISLFIIYIKVQNRRIYLDELTGVSNRRQIAREFFRRNDVPDPQRRIYAVMIDADDFKKINDRHGHAEGDRMLVCAAILLERVCAPRGDFLARMGGDEFLILASRRWNEPILLTREIEEAIRTFNAGLVDADYPLALSCGVAEFGKDGADTLDGLLSAADGAMYRSKAERKAARVPSEYLP